MNHLKNAKITCKFKHPKEDCDSETCSSRKCLKRHRRSCRYGGKCKRRESCEFLHKDQDSNLYISSLETEVESLKSIIAEMTVQIENLKKNFKSKKLQHLKERMWPLKSLNVISVV